VTGSEHHWTPHPRVVQIGRVSSPSILVYGAYGYTGELVLRRARAQGIAVIAAGRDAARTDAVARAHGFAARASALDDAPALDRLLDGVSVVLHCAGPFARTSRPMVDACLRRGVHYLDVTGELEVFEAVAARDAAAKAAGVVLLPGTGFDVVPSDCLAAHLARRLPTATRLALAFRTTGGISRGTATTMAENAGKGGAVRRGGRIVGVPAAWRARSIDFGDGRERLAVTIPWGDVSTAYHSTGIGDVEVYTAMSPAQRRSLVASRWLGWLLASGPVQRALLGRIRSGAAGPDDERRARGSALLWGEASDDAGRRVESRLRCPEGYTLTAMTAVECARRVAAGEVKPGFHTPSRAFGADFVLGFEGVTRTDVS
jgi:short subunit dehydrogenase-like uncharacterized protein